MAENCARRLLEVKASVNRTEAERFDRFGRSKSFSLKLGMANTNIHLFMVYPLQISPCNLVKNGGWNSKNLYVVRFLQCRARFRIRHSCWRGICNHSWSTPCREALVTLLNRGWNSKNLYVVRFMQCRARFRISRSWWRGICHHSWSAPCR